MIEQHEDTDEDDFEGYFLQPVNGYNIAEKVKSANQEWLSLPRPPSPLSSAVRVSFRPVLEDYEPDYFSHDGEEEEVEVECEEEEIESIVPEHASSEEDEEHESPVPPEIEEICDDLGDIELEPIEEIAVKVQPKAPEPPPPPPPLPQPPPEKPPTPKRKIERLPRQFSEAPSEPCTGVATVIVRKLSDSPKKRQKSSPKQVSPTRRKYRECCDRRDRSEDRLPRYNGLRSVYGLSREQLETRQMRLEREKRRQVERLNSTLDEQFRRNEANEEAFSQWLRKKMHQTHSSTKHRNMFDYKPPLRRKKKPS
ncbi:MAP7 domain-containing protein 1 [Lutzomyia longipalpis]|uniref:MAP7 domain-containing protein 1 n=1 Tax=Lutzomyia longipalpis TaxID=7200 RepID=UPI0024838C3F|nr:MAP7 domain-containing protein 1 [Lutzomyia longipalpis]